MRETYHIRLRAELRRVEDGEDAGVAMPWTAGGTMILTEEMLSMKMPRDVAAKLLLSKLFEDTLTVVAEQV
jgi:hypothetical protein